MLDQKTAAEYLVVAWCRDWTMTTLLLTLCDHSQRDGEYDDYSSMIDRACAEYSWLPKSGFAFGTGKTVRGFVGGYYPKLSSWLYARHDDVARLKCAAQVSKLKCPSQPAALRSKLDKAENEKAKRDYKAATASYRIARDAFKTNTRSSWNTCKA